MAICVLVRGFGRRQREWDWLCFIGLRFCLGPRKLYVKAIYSIHIHDK